MKAACAAIFALTASAASAETWQCTAGSYFSGNAAIVVTATTGSSDKPSTGKIAVAGTEFSTYYYVDGFDRRWDFGDMKDGRFPFSFVISPNGTGLYFDFRGAKDGQAQASQVYGCRAAK